MITLKVVDHEDEFTIKDYVESFQKNGELIEGNVGMTQFMDYRDWLFVFSNTHAERTHMILYHGIMVGTIDFRFPKNRKQNKTLGQIGYAIHPEFRSQGFATQALKLALPTYPSSSIYITCYKDNLASAKVIQNAGAQLEKEFLFDGKPSLRFIYKQ